MKKTIIPVLALAALPAAAFAMDQNVAVQPDTLKWVAVPPLLPPGSEMAVVAGDPMSDGAYIIRLKMPDGYKVPPHSHPVDENVTVLSGTLNLSMGPGFDPAQGQAFPAGGYFFAQKNVPHFAWATTPTIIQIHGTGPFGVNYVNPADDPRTTATTGSK